MLVYLGAGVLLMWLYAAIRPRYGPGPKTAAITGFAFWMIVCAVDVFWFSLGVVPATRGSVLMILVGLPIMVGATMLDAWAYKENGGVVEGTAEEG